MKLLCPICKSKMESTFEFSIFQCYIQRNTTIDGIPYIYYEAEFVMDGNGNCKIQTCEIPPYKITLYNKPDRKETVITKIYRDNKPFPLFKYDRIKLPYIVTLPWDDPEKVKEKLKLFFVFS